MSSDVIHDIKLGYEFELYCKKYLVHDYAIVVSEFFNFHGTRYSDTAHHKKYIVLAYLDALIESPQSLNPPASSASLCAI